MPANATCYVCDPPRETVVVPERPFKPRLGRIGGQASPRATRYSRRIIELAARGGTFAPRRRGKLNAHALRRGLAIGAIAAGNAWRPGTRRVVVRARYVRLDRSNLAPAAAHLGYILREGTARDREAGSLYGADGPADRDAFLSRSAGDPYQFRFIVAPEDAHRLADLEALTRDLVRQMERDLATGLDWVAVDHFNTAHPHTHLVVRGRDDKGAPLVMARDFISFGVRARAQDLVTRELGPETALERWQRQRNEVAQHRLTGLDRRLITRAKENVLVIASDKAPPPDEALLRGRLKTLSGLGLAVERHSGVWSLDAALAQNLRALGRRADAMQRLDEALAKSSLSRSPATFAIFDPSTQSAPLVGRLVATGRVDELNDKPFLVLDAADGRVIYAELGRHATAELPQPGAIVRLTANRSQSRLATLARAAQDADYDGPHWLDPSLASPPGATQASTGFAAELVQLRAARQHWLADNGFGRHAADGRWQWRPGASVELARREQRRLGQALAARLDVRYSELAAGDHIDGRLAEAIATPTGRLAVVRHTRGVSLLPWSGALDRPAGSRIIGVIGGREGLNARGGRERS